MCLPLKDEANGLGIPFLSKYSTNSSLVKSEVSFVLVESNESIVKQGAILFGGVRLKLKLLAGKFATCMFTCGR